jgi:hypothetical protein
MRFNSLIFCTIFSLASLPAAFCSVTPYPAWPGAAPSLAYKITVDGQPVFVHRFPTYNQFQWMDHASFSMSGKVHVTITSLVNERNIVTCSIRPLAYGIHPAIKGNTISFDLDQPRYLVIFFNEEPTFQSPGLLLFAEPEEKSPPKPGDPNVTNILDYKVDNSGKTLETEKINQAIRDVSAKPGGGVLLLSGRGISDWNCDDAEQCPALSGGWGSDSRVAQKCRLRFAAHAGRGSGRCAPSLSSTTLRMPALPGRARSTWKATRGCGTTSSRTPGMENRDRKRAWSTIRMEPA